MQLFVRGERTLCLDAEPYSNVQELKLRLEQITGWPVKSQRLILGGRQLGDNETLFSAGVIRDATLQLTGRLRGGKGGFGALLRAGARSSVSQNTDACRDLSGRRLRHVNADEKLKEWAAGSKERELEKLALQHIKDEIKAAERAAKAEVDVDAARTEHQAGMLTVREAINAAMSALPAGSKRSSVVEATAGTAAGIAPKRARVFADAVASGDSSSEDDSDDDATLQHVPAVAQVETAPTSDALQAAVLDADKGASGAIAEAGSGDSSDSAATGPQRSQSIEEASADGRGVKLLLPKLAATSSADEAANAAAAERAAQEPVILGQYESASALQAVGMARLGVALSSHGLKAGGSLHQRAERLFLLRTTPLAELDHKHFAKPLIRK